MRLAVILFLVPFLPPPPGLPTIEPARPAPAPTTCPTPCET
jgi:hypothetical protein